MIDFFQMNICFGHGKRGRKRHNRLSLGRAVLRTLERAGFDVHTAEVEGSPEGHYDGIKETIFPPNDERLHKEGTYRF